MVDGRETEMVGVRVVGCVGEVDGEGERVPSRELEPLTSFVKKLGAIAQSGRQHDDREILSGCCYAYVFFAKLQANVN